MPSNFKAVEARKAQHHSLQKRGREGQFRPQLPVQAQLVREQKHIFVKYKIENLWLIENLSRPRFPARGIVPKLNCHRSKEKHKPKNNLSSFNSRLSSSGFHFQPWDFAELFCSRLEYSGVGIVFPHNHTTIDHLFFLILRSWIASSIFHGKSCFSGPRLLG